MGNWQLDTRQLRQMQRCTACVPDVRALVLQLGGRGGEVWLAFADHSSDKGSPGWALRNALLLAAARWEVDTLRVAALRLRRGRACLERSLAISVRLLAIPAGAALSPGAGAPC